MSKKEKSENRKALPKFTLSLLGSLLVGGAVGFVVGLTRAFGLDTEALARGLNVLLEAATPWGIPVTSVLTLGSCFFLYRSAARKFAVWDGGDEDETSESIDTALSWVLLLSAVQLLLNLFFLSAFCIYWMDRDIRALALVGVFLLSSGLVIFAQQKAVDLERKMNPEKHGSVYDAKFQKKWLDSCDESERRQIGEASRRAYMVTTRLCLGLWLALVILSMLFDMSLLPVFVLLLVWGTMQVTYTLECIRLGKRD
ncbi:DUF3169 family protein [uncultured Oscillibacter sp.]|jgi:hypothetical protein|uniref:DUF3169 family protein n=1 Tax=uncultured Oscillibacter sp. TaxID=876091 RepID=UPI0025D2128F|nr:DUF3169 family protein [uncultured Oscillibacter sp.]